MGIDIGITDKSLTKCELAKCLKYRNEWVGCTFYEGKKPEKWYQHIHWDRRDAVPKEVTLPNAPIDDEHYAVESRYEVVGTKNKEFLGHSLGTEPKVKPVFVRWIQKGEFLKKAQWCHDNYDGNAQWTNDAWYNLLEYKKRGEICSNCPIKPRGDTSCYPRFSNYPGMDTFRKGFMLVYLYAVKNHVEIEQLKKEQKKYDAKSEKYRELQNKIIEISGGLFSGFKPEDFKESFDKLAEYSSSTPVNGQADAFFNKVHTLLGGLADASGKDVKMSLPKDFQIEQLPVHNFEQTISYLIYREDEYEQHDYKKLIPILKKIITIADYLIWDCDNGNLRKSVLSFRYKLDTLLEMMEIGQKFNLNLYMSY